MSFLDIDFDDVVEFNAVPAGEYRVRITEAKIWEEDPNKGNRRALRVTLDIVDHALAKPVSHFMNLPVDPTPEEQADPELLKKYQRRTNMQKLSLKNFFEAFRIDPKTTSIESYAGEECFAVLSVFTDDKYGEQNRVDRFIVSK